MTDDRSLERAARSWLEEGPTRAPLPAVDGALSRIKTTRQERGPWIPWRFPTMFSNRLTLAAIATVLVVALGGFALSRLTAPGPGGPGPTATATPTPTATPAPTMPAITSAEVGKTLEPGAYRVEGFATPLTLDLLPNWLVSNLRPNVLGLERRGDGNINVALIVLDKVYADPCDTSAGPTTIGPGVDDLVEAFSAMPGFEVTEVSDATVGGASGTSFRISNSIDVVAGGCSGDMLALGTYQDEGEDVDIQMFGGERDLFWVLDADGTRVLVAITDTPAIVAAARPALDGVTFGAAPAN